MDLIYADAEGNEIGVLKAYSFDLAYGTEENDFELTLSLSDHCLADDYRIYIDQTEYGGIVDAIEVKTEDREVVYSGRTWHGILDGYILAPNAGEDYLTVSGDANEIIRSIIERVGASDVFEGVTDTVLSIPSYNFRYKSAYQGLLEMFNQYGLKLLFRHNYNKVIIEAVLSADYSNDEEWDNDEQEFTVKQVYNATNHLICLGKGDLKDRYVIHLFTDENGNVCKYASTDSPKQDSDYILDESQKVMTGSNEIAEIYDDNGAGATENYLVLTERPWEWDSRYEEFYTYDEDDASYKQNEFTYTMRYALLYAKPADWDSAACNYYYVDDEGNYQKIESTSATEYTLQTSQPSDWAKNYSAYYTKDGSSYKAVEAVTKTTYNNYSKANAIAQWGKLSSGEPNWSRTYESGNDAMAYTQYFYYTSDGTTESYENLPQQTKAYYQLQTMQPSDWKTTPYIDDPPWAQYYVKATKSAHKGNSDIVVGKYYKIKDYPPLWNPFIAGGNVPTWKANKYYTQKSKNAAYTYTQACADHAAKPGTNYHIFKEINTTGAPAWEKNTYYTASAEPVSSYPEFALNKYWIGKECPDYVGFTKGTYYQKVTDNYAELVSKGLEKLADLRDGNTVEIDLNLDEGEYDVLDVVGARDNTTGVYVWKPITKKIVTIENGRVSIDYEIGTITATTIESEE